MDTLVKVPAFSDDFPKKKKNLVWVSQKTSQCLKLCLHFSGEQSQQPKVKRFQYELKLFLNDLGYAIMLSIFVLHYFCHAVSILQQLHYKEF